MKQGSRIAALALSVVVLTGGLPVQEEPANSNLTLDRVQPCFSFAPGHVVVEGSGLGAVTEATLDQVAVPIVTQRADSLVLAPPPRAPGFGVLRLTDGATGAARVMRMWPFLQARTDGVGGKLRISLSNGGLGSFVLGFGVDRYTAPRPVLAPSTWYGILIDLESHHAILDTGVFPGIEPRHLTYPVPDEPALVGKTLYFQAWCRQDHLGAEPTWSFTNLGQVTF